MASTPRKSAPAPKPGARSTVAAAGPAGKTINDRRKPALAIKAPSMREILAQREAQLDVIEAIQRGIAAKLDFRAITEVVGDKLSDLRAGRAGAPAPSHLPG